MKNVFPKHLKLLVVLFACPGLANSFDYGDPNANEQAHLERLNRARLNPLSEASRLGIDLFEGVAEGKISDTPVQPLSSNAKLLAAARLHSLDMLDRQFFAHDTPDGISPFDRIVMEDYDFLNAGENIAFMGSTAVIDPAATSLNLHDLLFIDEDFLGRGHRINILSPQYREVGVGLVFGDFIDNGTVFNTGMLTTDYGQRFNSLPILLGVVYQDQNNDGQYTAGEGLADVVVSVLETGDNTITASAGGYGLELPNGSYKVTFSHPGLGSITKNVQINDQNVKLDALQSEFAISEAPSQCATFADNQLQIPCVTVADGVFQATLSVTAGDPTTFTLNEILEIDHTVTAQCAMYTVTTENLHLPCVSANQQVYWANLSLTDDDPVTLQLKNYGLNQQ